MNKDAYIQGYAEKVAASDTMRQLLKAKLASDKRDWGTKNAILRKLLKAKRGEFAIDEERGRIAGVTHTPSNFRIHMPREAIPKQTQGPE